MSEKLHDIPARLVAETEKAWLLDVGLKEAVWLPKSQCEYDPADKILTIPESFAIFKGMDNLL